MSGAFDDTWFAELLAAARRWWAAPFSVVPSTSAPALMAISLALQEREAAARRDYLDPGPLYNEPPSHALLLDIQTRIIGLASHFVCRDCAVLLSGWRPYDHLAIYTYDAADILASDHSMQTLPGLEACDYSAQGNAALNTVLLDCRYWLKKFKLIDVSAYCKWRRKHEYNYQSSDYPPVSSYDTETPTDGWFDITSPQTEGGTRLAFNWFNHIDYTGSWYRESCNGTLYSGPVLQNPVGIACKIALFNCSPLYFNIGSDMDMEVVVDSSTTPPTRHYYGLVFSRWAAHLCENDGTFPGNYSDYWHEVREETKNGSDIYIDTWSPTNKMEWRQNTRTTEADYLHEVGPHYETTEAYLEGQPNWAIGWVDVAARSKVELPALSTHPGYPQNQIAIPRAVPDPSQDNHYECPSSAHIWTANFTAHAIADYSVGYQFN